MTDAPQPPGRTPHRSAAVSRRRDSASPGGGLRAPGPPEASALLPGAPPARRPAREAITLISASDTDLLAARASGAPWRLANPARTAPDEVPGLVAGSFCVIVRLLGGRRSWPEGLAAVLAQGLPTVVLSGEAAPDA